jgi:HK97 family phage major capsid protein
LPIAALKTAVDTLAASTTETLATVKRDMAALQAHNDRIDAVLKRPGFGGGQHANDNSSRTDELKALASYCRTGDETDLRASMSVRSDPDGGYTVLPAISSGWTKKLFDSVAMRRLARVETITTGDRWVEPLDIDDIDATWVGEKSSRPETDTATLGQLTVPVHEIYALQPVTQRLLDDTGFDLGGWVDGKVTEHSPARKARLASTATESFGRAVS